MKDIDKRIKEILKDFEQEASDAYTEPEVGIDFKALDEAYRNATQQILKAFRDIVPEKKSGFTERLSRAYDAGFNEAVDKTLERLGEL